MTNAIVHIAGAGLAGLAAATRLAENGVAVEIFEAAPQAGGRARSYFDSTLGRIIDNGNHLVLAGNEAVAEYLARIDARDALAGPSRAEFAFADLGRGESWTIRPSEGAVPWWLLSRARRVPGTGLGDYAAIVRLMRARSGRVDASFACTGALWDRLLRPVLLAALNTRPEEASARLAAAILRKTLAKGGRAMRPRVAHPYLAAAFVDPALAYLEKRGAALHFSARLTHIGLGETHATDFSVSQNRIPIGADNSLILALPPWTAAALVPGTPAPDSFRAIVNGHFAAQAPARAPRILGVLGGTAEWIFAFPERISVTVSDADRLVDTDRAELAAIFWRDIQKAYGISDPIPAWQIVKEKRATFAATPEEDAKRPPAATRWRNVFLAGDWTDTGLPATIEGAIRSGLRAADAVLNAKRAP